MTIDENAPTDPAPAPASPAWLVIAEHEVGIQEIAGKRANPRIVEYLATTSLPASMAGSDETAWCSAFINFCMERAGIAGTGKANARSWLDWGYPLALPKRGAVMVFSRDSAGPAAGHVAFYLNSNTTPISGRPMFDVLGGNQANRVCVKSYPADRLLGIRWPKQ